MAEDSIEKNKFTTAELQSKYYRWREERKIKFFIFTNSSFSKADQKAKRARKHVHYKGHEEKLDPDLCHLLTNFIKPLKPLIHDYKKDIEITKNRTATELMDRLDELVSDTSLYDYDCFFFIMLTFFAGAGRKDTGLLYGDENTIINLDEVYKSLDNVNSMLNKPKVFLVQADSISLLNELSDKTICKGTEQTRPVKIPHEADRITIMSTIPILNPTDKDNPSPLIQAFVDVMEKDKERPREERVDFFSLTGRMNEEVKKKLDKFKEEHPNFKHKDFTVPLVTSTLRRELIF